MFESGKKKKLSPMRLTDKKFDISWGDFWIFYEFMKQIERHDS